MMNIKNITNEDVKQAFNLKKHQSIDKIEKCSGSKADQEAELQRIIAEAEAEGYRVNVRRVGNMVHIDKQKPSTDKIIDGHFWVEYKGKNIDLTTDELATKIKGKKDRMVYLPVDEAEGQAFYEEVYNRLRDKHIAKGYDWDEWIEDAVEKYENGFLGSFDCVQGAIVLKTKYGDQAKIRYGQVGALQPDGLIFWYFGHPDEPKEMWEKPRDQTNFMSHKTNPSSHPALIYDPRTPASFKKQKPNEKCLCGSTKKFKVCCGRCF
jgi:uncharacterized protein (UPF0335 family)